MSSVADQKTILYMNRLMAASRERVFQAWTTPEEIKVWFGPETCTVLAAQIDLRVNGEFCFDISSRERGNLRLRGTYREITPPSKLVYTWRWEGNPELALENSLVTVEFVELGGSTEIRLTHENLPSDDTLPTDSGRPLTKEVQELQEFRRQRPLASNKYWHRIGCWPMLILRRLGAGESPSTFSGSLRLILQLLNSLRTKPRSRFLE
jgi:uncharacterized protein YndB with AHSA1/START domain